MMETNSATMSLLGGIEENVPNIEGVKLYLFGSFARGENFPADVDVLLVYPDGDLSRGHEVAETIRELPAAEIYDVIALSESEERELKFIESEHAIHIWPPNAGSF